MPLPTAVWASVACPLKEDDLRNPLSRCLTPPLLAILNAGVLLLDLIPPSCRALLAELVAPDLLGDLRFFDETFRSLAAELGLSFDMLTFLCRVKRKWQASAAKVRKFDEKIQFPNLR